MTNDELSNNSPSNSESNFVEFKCNLSYHKTEWGRFYESYKMQGQGQLQKALLKNKNDLIKSGKMRMNPYEMIKWIQHIFYMTEWDETERTFKTPSILLRSTKHGYQDSKYNEDHLALRKTVVEVFNAYRQRCLAEHKEVKSFYETRKNDLKLEQKQLHKLHANEHVVCPYCNFQVARTNLSRHMKTNKKCKTIRSVKEENNVEDLYSSLNNGV